ncbi:MAG: macro domain-containing protein [Candidatus Krumholzibacteriota bacterium]|nr:macro domain-containing protein [Candidatus Krumholzibacteriota bacterium]
MKRNLQGITLECVKGDITRQSDMEAIVNAANAQLLVGGGVAGAIHRAAGPELERECRPLAPILPGQAVITGAHNLPNHSVVHCLGPIYGIDEPAGELLGACYRNALQLAEQNRIASIAFPAISTGAFGYPMEPAARVAFETVISVLPRLSSVQHIRFVLFHDADVRVHEGVLEDLTGGNDAE